MHKQMLIYLKKCLNKIQNESKDSVPTDFEISLSRFIKKVEGNKNKKVLKRNK